MVVFTTLNLPASPQVIYMHITSPDHPQTWVVGANRESQTLRWDGNRRILLCDVKYSTKDYADSVNPAESDSHTLTFPRVHLAANGVDLCATNREGQTATIGQLRNGLFGKEVVLNKHVDLNVHRIDGAIHAALNYNSLVAD